MSLLARRPRMRLTNIFKRQGSLRAGGCKRVVPYPSDHTYGFGLHKWFNCEEFTVRVFLYLI